MPGRLEVAGFAASFTLAGILAVVFVFAGDATYAGLADPAGGVVRVGGALRGLDRPALLEVHRATLGYVLGQVEILPDAPGTGTPIFDAAERSHLADVRGVFGGVRVALAIALLALVWRLARGWGRGRSYIARLARDGAVASALGVTAFALVVAVAFEPLFLAFHLVFFPQGNYLFDPATSNLLAVYPEPYWYGVTLRVGLGFVALAAVVAATGAAALRHANGARH